MTIFLIFRLKQLKMVFYFKNDCQLKIKKSIFFIVSSKIVTFKSINLCFKAREKKLQSKLSVKIIALQLIRTKNSS